MSQFELLFGLYGLLLGLGIAELAAGFSRVYDRRAVEPIGWLAPGLAALLICDLFTFWLAAWRFRDWPMEYPLALAGGAVGLTYYFACTQVFPRDESTEPAEARAFAHRRTVVFCLVAINLLVFVMASVWRVFDQDFAARAVATVVINLIYLALLACIYVARSPQRAAYASWTAALFLILMGAGLHRRAADFLETMLR